MVPRVLTAEGLTEGGTGHRGGVSTGRKKERERERSTGGGQKRRGKKGKEKNRRGKRGGTKTERGGKLFVKLWDLGKPNFETKTVVTKS